VWQAPYMGVSGAELALRQLIVDSVHTLAERNGGIVTRQELSSFSVGGENLRLIDNSKGIWNPRWMSVTLSITSTPNGPYEDSEIEGGLFKYKYRSGSSAGDNTKLRAAVASGVPLILFRWIASNIYVPHCPVYLIADNPDAGFVTVALDESLMFLSGDQLLSVHQRRYAERVTRVRLHQPEFRGRVMVAYERKCTICDLQHPALLDAAHIIPDGEPLGAPVVENGLSLCKIHHAAYDQEFLGIDPDHQVHINQAMLVEKDGPMLKHGLQEMHGRTITLPKLAVQRPDRERLALRFERFRAAG
jgi:putative restriction endonuclease